jgi:hypothetical protein
MVVLKCQVDYSPCFKSSSESLLCPDHLHTGPSTLSYPKESLPLSSRTFFLSFLPTSLSNPGSYTPSKAPCSEFQGLLCSQVSPCGPFAWFILPCQFMSSTSRPPSTGTLRTGPCLAQTGISSVQRILAHSTWHSSKDFININCIVCFLMLMIQYHRVGEYKEKRFILAHSSGPRVRAHIWRWPSCWQSPQEESSIIGKK